MTKTLTTLLAGVLLMIGLPAVASLPRVTINNVEHYLADYDSSKDEWFESANGYCVQSGFRYAESSMSTSMNVKPIAELDAQGRVVRTFPDYQNGRIWVVQSVNCAK